MPLTATDLTCVRGGRVVFEDLGFELKEAQAALLTGANGTGKTSLLRIVAGLLRPAQGAVVLTGCETDAPLGEQCHYVGHLNGIKRALTVAENARFWAAYLGGEADPDAALEWLGLGALADIPAGLLSSGQTRRLALARLLLAPRPIWLLDEPSVSLDAQALDVLIVIMTAHVNAGGLLMVASHAPLGLDFALTLRLGEGRGGS